MTFWKKVHPCIAKSELVPLTVVPVLVFFSNSRQFLNLFFIPNLYHNLSSLFSNYFTPDRSDVTWRVQNCWEKLWFHGGHGRCRVLETSSFVTSLIDTAHISGKQCTYTFSRRYSQRGGTIPEPDAAVPCVPLDEPWSPQSLYGSLQKCQV